MKILRNNIKSNAKAFTLIEMIGVLAVIGILAALLIPKIFDAINSARVNGAAVSINTIKTATADHYAKYGILNSSNGTTLAVTAPITNFDGILVAEQVLDKPLALKIAPSNIFVSLVPVPATNGGAVTAPAASTFATSTTASDWSFDLAASNNPAVNTVAGSVGVVVCLQGILETDAKALNDIIDGPTLGVALGNSPDYLGRVKYTQAVGGLVDVTIYVTHR
jgi:prepilin-type N-terminal cleavage/methylation domain-containing protein